MEDIVVADFTDAVLVVLNAARTSVEAKELHNAMGEAVAEHVYTQEASYTIAGATEGDETAATAAAVEGLQAFLADEANADADAVLLAKSPHATHCEATLNDGQITIKYQFKYLEISAQGPAIDGALVVQGAVLVAGFRPALCCVTFTSLGGEVVEINVGPGDFIFDAAEEATDAEVDTYGSFAIPVQGLPEVEGSVRVQVLVGKYDERLAALYAGAGEEEAAAFLSADSVAAMKGGEGECITALAFTVAARVGGGEGGGGSDDFIGGDAGFGDAAPEGAAHLVLASLRLAVDQDEMSAMRAEGYELTCVHVDEDGRANDNEGAWPFFVMARYGPAEDGGVTGVAFVTVPKAAAADGAEEAKDGSALPPAVEETDGGIVETFIQTDLAASDAAESIFLQVTTSAAGGTSGVFQRLTMLSVGSAAAAAAAASSSEESGEGEGETEGEGAVDAPAAVSVQTYLAGLSAPTHAFTPLPDALAAALGLAANSAGLLLQTVAPEAAEPHSGLSAAEEEAAAEAEAAAEEEEQDEAQGSAQGSPRDDMSHMTGSDAGSDDYEENEGALAESLEAKLAELVAEHDELESQSAELQKKTVVFIARERAALQGQGQKSGSKDAPSTSNDEENEAANERTAEKEKVLLETLSGIIASRAKISQQTADYDQLAHDLQTRLDDREYKANEISESFGQFKIEILAKAENTRTSKPLSRRLIKQFEVAQAKRDEDLERARLRNISMRTSLLRLERQLRSREQLAEGLHMIDFEQLKVENQTLYEKIEERTEELTKLNRKKTNTVQVLTHVREKLRFIEKTNVQLNKELSAVENETMGRRGTLTGGKKARDSVRDDNKELKRKQGFASSSGLLVDYDKRSRALGDAHALLKELQVKYDTVAAQCAKDEEYVLAMQQGRSLPGSAMYSGAPTQQGLRAGGIGGTNMGSGYQQKALPQTPYFPGAKPESDAYPPLMG